MASSANTHQHHIYEVSTFQSWSRLNPVLVEVSVQLLSAFHLGNLSLSHLSTSCTCPRDDAVPPCARLEPSAARGALPSGARTAHAQPSDTRGHRVPGRPGLTRLDIDALTPLASHTTHRLCARLLQHEHAGGARLTRIIVSELSAFGARMPARSLALHPRRASRTFPCVLPLVPCIATSVCLRAFSQLC